MRLARPIAAGLAVLGAAAATSAARVGGRALSARTERRLNQVAQKPPYGATDRAIELHRRSTVVDLHADSLLWGRDLLLRADRGHVDVPRLIEGGVALQVFAATTKVPRHLNIERNDGRSDDIRLVALVQGWPPATWRSLVARAEYLARRLREAAERSSGRLTVIRTADDLRAFLARRAVDPAIVAGLLAIEGAHALDDDPANLDRLVAAGYRMVGLTHFFDNTFAGSAHGVDKGGLTPLGRELVGRLEAAPVLVDLAHASAATIDDVLAIAVRPVVVSHTGVRGTADNARNLSDDQLRGVAATGGLVGIGFWPTATGGNDAASIGRAMVHAVGVIGADHVALGSDFDGAVPVPFDVTGLVLLTEALIAEGLADEDIMEIMGGNAVHLLTRCLPRG
ncbi:MAG TPA: membrane dipeptidase [Candidatus Limnocylindrales bacterium]|nr:membrane dipeptidase [Candidatus Limnocylindrales bacterium]